MNAISPPGILTVTAKGQVTLRKDLLAHLGVVPGDKIRVEARPDGSVEISAARKGHRLEDLAGILKDKTRIRATLKDIERAIQDGWAGKR